MSEGGRNCFLHLRVSQPQGAPVLVFQFFNSAAGLIAAEKASDFKEGIAQAAESIDSGNAQGKLEQLIQFTNA